MEIQIAQIENMGQSGKSLLRSIQNNSTPILDLLVRESVQNSLDAAISDEKDVKVDFILGDFIPHELNQHLSGSTDALDRRFSFGRKEYLAIRDKGTEGLTGKVSNKLLSQNESYGNLLKLVYEIGKAQEKQGAGGSWGLGKTVYFRVGIGLVIYYSRIQLGWNNYESRLAVTMIEDEDDITHSIIPGDGTNKKRRGIAWWGQSYEGNTTIPITDEEEILNILKVFNIKPYKGTDTGTTVIIPYIDQQELLKNNRKDYFDKNNRNINPPWYRTVPQYLRIAVQRWFAPRIDNKYYIGAKLMPRIIDKVEMESEEIRFENMDRSFQALQTLYNYANPMTGSIEDHYLEAYGVSVMTEEINLRGIFETIAGVKKPSDKKISGCIAFASLNKNYLEMNPPYNNPSPYYYFGLDDDNKDSNRPVISYARKPGMLVEFADTGQWVQGIPESVNNEYLVGVFVLNSNRRFLQNLGMDENDTLEDYVRNTENADHIGWKDGTYKGITLKIIEKTQKHVAKVIAGSIKPEELKSKGKAENKLSRDLGKLLLPPVGFGTSPNRIKSTKKNSMSKNLVKGKSSVFECSINNGIIYTDVGIDINVILKAKKEIKNKFEINLNVSSESGIISQETWDKEMFVPFPFDITKIDIANDNLASRNSILKVTNISDQNIKFEKKYSKDGICCGLTVDAIGITNLKLSMLFSVKVSDRTLIPVFVGKEKK